MMENIHPVTCPFCSLCCSDLHLSFDGDGLVGFTPACSLGETGFRRSQSDLSGDDPVISFHETSLRTAQQWLQEARQPMVVLSGNLEGGAVSAAIRLAKQFSAILTCDEESTGSIFGLSMQAAGLLTNTLHDLRDLSLVVLCGVDPAHTHPRLGEFLGRDLATDSLFLNMPDPLEALRWFRLAGTDKTVHIPTKFAEAATRIGVASSGLVVFGPEWLKFGKPFAAELLLWLKDLKGEKHWYGLYMAPAPNSTGVVETLLSETGFPGNLRFCQEQAEYSPRLWRVERIIQQGASDLCLLVGQPGSFSEKILALLSKGRTILLDPHQPAWNPPVWLPTARVGVEGPGRFQRLDGVPVEFRQLLQGSHPLMKDLLLELTYEEPQV